MKTEMRISVLLIPVVFAAALLMAPGAARCDDLEPVEFSRRNLGGPRFGVTAVTGSGTLVDELDNEDMGRVISQFGWHFERQVIPKGGGPQFVVEFIPLLAGVEYGKFIPNLTAAMGVRTPGGYEVGMGPNVFFSKTLEGDVEARTSLMVAVGKSLNYGGVSIPLNVAWTTNPDGDRVSFVIGYAIASAR